MTRSRLKNDFSIGIDDSATSTKLTVTNSGVAGTLTTAAQPNITSVGTLTGFTSTGIDDNATSTALTIQADGDVGLGNTSPICPLDVTGRTGAFAISMRARSNNDYAFFGMRSYDGTEDLGDIAIQRTAADTGRMLFYTNNGGAATTKLTVEPNGDIKANSGNVVIGTNGKGIDFSAAGNISGMTSELLDDYEEGTFSPTITSGVNSISYGARSGHYTKIGNFVYCDIYIYYSGTGSGAQFIVSDLPFTQKNANYIRGGGCSSYQNRTSNTVQFYGAQGTTYFYCYLNGSSAFTTSGSVGNYLIGNFTYIAA